MLHICKRLNTFLTQYTQFAICQLCTIRVIRNEVDYKSEIGEKCSKKKIGHFSDTYPLLTVRLESLDSETIDCTYYLLTVL